MMILLPPFQRLLVFAFLGLCGCETINVHGHEVTPEQLKKIKVGKTTKKEITEALGTPSTVSPFNNRTWFYMYELTSTRAFFSPSVLKSSITRLEFDDKGVVRVLDSLTEVDKRVVSHVRRTTPTAGHTDSLLQQLIGNVGRFDGKDPDLGRRGH